MRRFDGNSVLIVVNDFTFGRKLLEELQSNGAKVSLATHLEEAIKILDTQDFDLVVANYYLADGLIYKLMEWCHNSLQIIPIFVAIGSALPSEEELLRRYFITTVLSKNDVDSLVNGLHVLLFDFNKFKESLIDMIEDRGIALEIIVRKQKVAVKPIELTQDGIFLSFEGQYAHGTCALLRVSLFESKIVESFILLGTFGNYGSEGQLFRINELYEKIWERLLTRLEQKQIIITDFMHKVMGT